ncbi:bacteriorhodopsin [Amnibacterium sp. CER49]|uniref:bacteriorhodopsin n=1 Tax=Amnibacterium sp. CER49 TaxID=3039161 RepID=UPI002446E936|nr:bacteriorhodopsin [Amnibacterium sp. CER49]MDH2444057.1 bacteriorhodopsin [Amnibacterium sp. CER49]
MIQPPWTQSLSQSEHDLVLFGLVAAGLALLATLVRIRFTSRESYATYRVASLTANAVVAIAFASYVGLVAAFLLGYRATGSLEHVVYVPLPAARYAWAIRYMDWVVTVPLLVVELLAISALGERTLRNARRIGIVSAIGMIVSGFLGAFVIASGRSIVAYTVFGLLGAAFFGVLYAVFFRALVISLPRLPLDARSSYRSGLVLLLITWLAYPMVYGLVGAFSGAVVVVIGQLALSGADLIAKVGFGTLVHRTAVLLSRHEEELDPGRPRRPRAPENESVYVSDIRTVAHEQD